MAVVFQVAGRLRASDEGVRQKLQATLAGFDAQLKGHAGFIAARLLASYSTQQFQLLLYWQTYEAGAAFQRGAYPGLARALEGLVDPQGTLVTSVLERSVEAAQA